MACSNCFNGCADVISDQCVKYTGEDILALGIKNGDPLLVVENQIVDKILKLMDGTGIIPTLNSNDVCTLVSSFMPCCPPYNLNVVITALVKSICAIDVRLVEVEEKLDELELDILALNVDYIIPGCFAGTPPDTDTHAIVQLIMNKVCSVSDDLRDNYTRTEDLDEVIGAYISGQTTSTKYNTRMVPWVAYPIFFIPNNAFDGNGAGIVGGAWEDIYYCNGKNGTPDIRGRVVVGSTDMASGGFDPEVDPSNPINPTWSISPNFQKNGVNAVPLTINHLPSHNHEGEIFITDPGHTHTYNAPVYEFKADFASNERVFRGVTSKVEIDSKKTGLKGNESPLADRNVTLNITNRGGDAAHANIQPGIGAFYIMYIPKP